MSDLTRLCDEIKALAKFDVDLSFRCDKAEEYARIYLQAKKAKGCNGLGELETLLDEFKKMIYEVVGYCRKRKYIDDLAIYAIEVTNAEIEKLSMHLEASAIK